MIIAGLEIFSYQLALIQPVALKGRTMENRTGLLVRVTSASGFRGWGEIAPLQGVSRENPSDARKQALHLRTSLPGVELPDDWVPLEGNLLFLPQAANLTPAVRFGIELALWNLWLDAGRPRPTGEEHETPLDVFLNGLLAGRPDEVLDQAQALVKAGYRAVKLKVGGKPLEADIQLTLKLREVIGDEVGLRLDANRAWSLEDAVRFGKAVNGSRIEYIEEPLADPASMTTFTAECGLPVALDETLLELPIERLDKGQGITAVVLKPTLLGGFHLSMQLALKARQLGLMPVVSSTFETGVGIAGLARFAAIVSKDTPVGLDTYRWLATDVMVPRIETCNGRIDLTLLEQRHREVSRLMLEELIDA
ncbi:MAG: o-succinylbenzoate synthase [Candidatus Binatia bacterium]